MQQVGKQSLRMRPRKIDVYLCFVFFALVSEVRNRLLRIRSSLAIYLKFRAARTGKTNQAKKSHLAAAVRRTGGKKTVPT